MSRPEAGNKDLVRKAVAALGRGDIDGFLADATYDFEFVLAGQPPGGNTVRGKTPLLELLQAMFGAKIENGAIEMTNHQMIAEGDTVVETADGRARTVDGRDYNNRYCRVWRFRDGQIASLTEYMDTELARACLWT